VRTNTRRGGNWQALPAVLLFREIFEAVMPSDHRSETPALAQTKRQEIAAFVVLAVLIWPVLAVGVVGGYGFLIWMYQIVFGPPGPPH
jgi:nitrate reductase NapE